MGVEGREGGVAVEGGGSWGGAGEWGSRDGCMEREIVKKKKYIAMRF